MKPKSEPEPPAEAEAGRAAKLPQQQPPSSAAVVVGDGGLSWRMKALARAKAQAAEGGASLAAVVSERWGSLGGLTSALTEGRAADGEAAWGGEAWVLMLEGVWVLLSVSTWAVPSD